MEESEETMSVNILKNLQKLEKYTTQEKISDSEMDTISELLIETAESTYELISSEETEIAIQILDLLKFLDRVGLVYRRK
jgi:hypothetical protein